MSSCSHDYEHFPIDGIFDDPTSGFSRASTFFFLGKSRRDAKINKIRMAFDDCPGNRTIHKLTILLRLPWTEPLAWKNKQFAFVWQIAMREIAFRSHRVCVNGIIFFFISAWLMIIMIVWPKINFIAGYCEFWIYACNLHAKDEKGQWTLRRY